MYLFDAPNRAFPFTLLYGANGVFCEALWWWKAAGGSRPLWSQTVRGAIGALRGRVMNRGLLEDGSTRPVGRARPAQASSGGSSAIRTSISIARSIWRGSTSS